MDAQTERRLTTDGKGWGRDPNIEHRTSNIECRGWRGDETPSRLSTMALLDLEREPGALVYHGCYFRVSAPSVASDD
jgi:hypothetical protein